MPKLNPKHGIHTKLHILGTFDLKIGPKVITVKNFKQRK
jgi:hypothetical protein